MDNDLKKILKTLGVEDGEYYINDDGRVKKKGILFDENTGIYQTASGEFKKEGILFDESTGLKQNERGEFKEEGIIFDKDTGIYQDNKGNYKKKGIIFDEKTGYYQDKDGNIKKEGVFKDSSHINTRSSNSKRYSSSEDDISTFFVYAKWLFILSIVILVVFLSPLLLLIWYLIKKREMQWVAVLSMIFSSYLVYDITSDGFITHYLMKILKIQKTGEGKYFALGYFVVFATTLGLFIDKYSSTKIPVVENGNFFQQRSIKERRPFIAGFSVLLLVIFSIFQFVNFSSSNNYNDYKYYNQDNSTTVNQSNSNLKNNQTNIITSSKGELAVISDSDGYTNLRSGKGTSYSIVKKIYSNEKFTVFPSNEKWWKVKADNGIIGYIFHNRVDLLNKEFYIINVTATKTETKALSEVKKLINKGYNASHLWIPNYKSLSGANFYSVYIGPFNTKNECIREVEKYRQINGVAYGTLVSQENKRVEIRSASNIKIIDNYHKVNTSNGIYSKASERLLKKNELANMSKSELQIMRNEIFARYGHSFKPGGKMEQYFNNQNWYINKNIDATMLITEIEQRNIELIQKYE